MAAERWSSNHFEISERCNLVQMQKKRFWRASRQVRRAILRISSHPLRDCGMDRRTGRDVPRRGQRQFPFPCRRCKPRIEMSSGKYLQDPPPALQGVVHDCQAVWLGHVGIGNAENLILERVIHREALRFRLLQHPLERDLCQSAFRLGISSADVGMHTCKPDLLDVLGVSWIQRPQILPKCGSSFIDRNRLAANFYVGVGSRERQRQRIVQPAD